jgi:DNA modification methylase
MDYKPKIINGDTVDIMKTLDNESIDTIITSPPYWDQRDYENKNQWGNESNIDEYIQNMSKWASECRRILKNEGTLFLNIGDKYSKKSLLMIPERLCLEMLKNGWVLRNKIIWYKPNHQPSGVKDRFTNTWEYIYFFTKDSGKYYNYKYYQNIDVLRIKPKTVEKKLDGFPETLSIEEYINDNYETKIKTYNDNKTYNGKYNNQTKNIGGSAGGRKSKNGISYTKKRIHEITPYLKSKIHKYLKLYYNEWKKSKNSQTIDQILGYKDKAGHWFREDPGGSLPLPDDWIKLKNILNFDDKYDDIMTNQHYVLNNVKNNPKGKNPGDMWNISLKHSKEKHFAAFPPELPEKIIDGFCPPDGIVLDTFAGSGTTGVAAMNKKVKSIMIELNPEYCGIMEKRFTD